MLSTLEIYIFKNVLIQLFNCYTYNLSPHPNHSVVATAWKLQVVFEFPNAKVLDEPLEPGLLPSLNCFALWAGQIIFRVKTVNWELLFLRRNRRSRRNRWSREERDHFLAELEEQFQIVHEQLALLCQGPISKTKLKREQMKEGRTRRQKRFSPGWDWWRWWRASATLTPRNLRKQVVVGLAMVILFQSTMALDLEKEVTTRYPRMPQRQLQLPYPLSKIQRSKKRAGPWITVRKNSWAWISILPRENLGWTTHITEALYVTQIQKQLGLVLKLTMYTHLAWAQFYPAFKRNLELYTTKPIQR